jgi:hypothetical protein
LDSLGDDEKLMRATGKHVQFQGLVFKNFNRHENVGQPFEVTNANYNILVCDWHPVKPIYITYLSINPRNIWYVWAESRVGEHIVDSVAQEIFSKLKYRSSDGLYINVMLRKYFIDSIANTKQIQEGRHRPKSIIDMFKELGIRFIPVAFAKNNEWANCSVDIDKKFKLKELYIDPSCVHHIRQISTWGAKRYSRGDLEGGLRDQVESEEDDTCVNLMYAQNERVKFYPVIDEQEGDRLPVRQATKRIYGGMRA